MFIQYLYYANLYRDPGSLFVYGHRMMVKTYIYINIIVYCYSVVRL